MHRAGRVANGWLRGRPRRRAAPLERERDCERRTAPDSLARCLKRSAVPLHEMSRQREAEAKSVLRLAHRRCVLPERLEQIRKEVGRDAGAGVGHDDAHPGVFGSDLDRDPPPCGVNLTAFDSRFENTCCSRTASARTIRPSASPERSMCSCFDRAFSAICSTAAAMTVDSAIVSGSSRSVPVAMRPWSSTSSTSRFCTRAFRSIAASA